MKVVHAAFDTIFLGHLIGLLQSEGIEAVMTNQYSAGAFGELPPSDAMPQVCVDEKDFARATQIVEEALQASGDDPPPDWRCPACGETIEGQYAQCWHCGAMHPSSK